MSRNIGIYKRIVNKQIKKLITKYFDLQLSEDEAKVLVDWINEGNRDVFNDYVLINYTVDEIEALRQGPNTKIWNRILAKIEVPKGKVVKFRPWRYVAAAGIFAFMAVILLTFYQSNTSDALNTVVKQQAIMPGIDKAVLTLESGEQVVLEKGKEYNLLGRKSDGESLVYSDAKNVNSVVQYNYLTVPRGGEFFVQLSDGTKVWLNSDSKLKYPLSFVKGETRVVELLYGEAYFDVSPSEHHDGAPFRVKNQIQRIEVLGTEFNVRAYQNEESSYTTLVEGSVAIGNDIINKVLKPGQQSKIGKRSELIEVYKVDVAQAIAWKNGYFMFKKESLESMLKTLSRWYDLEITYENDERKNEVFSGFLKRSDNIVELLDNIEMTGDVDFEIKNKKIVVK